MRRRLLFATLLPLFCGLSFIGCGGGSSGNGGIAQVSSLSGPAPVFNVNINDPAYVASQSKYLDEEQHLTQALHYNKGDKNNEPVLVAVIDAGAYRHAELGTRFHPDSYDFMFDDNDPFIDDQEVKDFVYFGPYDHGTAVCSVIAGQHNNEFLAGVAPNVQILLIRAFDLDGYTTLQILEDAVHYARLKGAKVINMSWGGIPEESSVREALYLANQDGALCVAAAPNYPVAVGLDKDNNEYADYPLCYPWVIGVGGTERREGPNNQVNVIKAGFSAYGSGIDVFARGRSVTTFQGFELVFTPPFTYQVEYGFRTIDADGNSFAAPQISGLLAIAKAERPDLTVEQVRSLLGQSSQDLLFRGKKLIHGGEFMWALQHMDQTLTQPQQPQTNPLPPSFTPPGSFAFAAAQKRNMVVADLFSAQSRAERAASMADPNQRIQLIKPMMNGQELTYPQQR